MSTNFGMIMNTVLGMLFESFKQNNDEQSAEHVFRTYMYGVADMMRRYIVRTDDGRYVLHCIECEQHLFGRDYQYDTFLIYGLLWKLSSNPLPSHPDFKPLQLHLDIKKLIDDSDFQHSTKLVERISIRLMIAVLNIISTFEHNHTVESINNVVNQTFEYKLLKHMFLQGVEAVDEYNKVQFVKSVVFALNNSEEALENSIAKIINEQQQDPLDKILLGVTKRNDPVH